MSPPNDGSGSPTSWKRPENHSFDKSYEDPTRSVQRLARVLNEFIRSKSISGYAIDEARASLAQVNVALPRCKIDIADVDIKLKLLLLRSVRQELISHGIQVEDNEADLAHLGHPSESQEELQKQRRKLAAKLENLTARQIQLRRNSSGWDLSRDVIVLQHGDVRLSAKEICKRALRYIFRRCPFYRAQRIFREYGFLVDPQKRRFVIDWSGKTRIMLKVGMKVSVWVDGIREIETLLIEGIWVDLYSPPTELVNRSSRPSRFKIPREQVVILVPKGTRLKYLRERATTGRVRTRSGYLTANIVESKH